jgi:hypothetical protein
VRRIGRSARLGALLLGLCFAAGAPAACGGGAGSDAEDEIETAVRDVQRAFAAGNTDRVCALISAAARKHIRAMGHDVNPQASEPCYFDLYMFIEGVEKSPTWRERTAREIGDIEVEGDRATATVRFEDGQTASLPLVHEEGRWRVDALYGGIPAGRQRDSY